MRTGLKLSSKIKTIKVMCRRKTMKRSLPELSPRNRQDFCPLREQDLSYRQK